MSRKLIAVNPALDERHWEQIRAAAERHGFEALFFREDAQALPHLYDAEIVFGQSEALAKNSPLLRWLCTPSAGVNQFAAPDAFASPDAVLTNSSGAYGVTISEHIVMLALEMLRRQMDYSAIVERREWKRDLPVRSIKGSRITLLGTGDIGRETALRLRAFGPACLLGVNRSGGNPSGLFDQVIPQSRLDEALPETDLLVISLPGTPETFHMLDARRLALLPGQALVINVGRGTVIDQKALEAELRRNRLCAALDVFEQEPLPPDDSLWDCPNLLMAPHVAGNMTLPYTKDRIVALFLEDFENYCAGRPLLRQVDLTKGY
ncbi:MAG: D-2-hydroxyacid dehydrogenase [Clostridia bacterium]|nr:D-2-hydroxyacid dehydrogenase [Clostridia bacterium]